MIQVGTSGFDYLDWQGFFYPEALPRKSWLAYYAEHFSALELNFSYYHMPSAKQLDSMVHRTDGQVTFAIKAHKSMTHDRVATAADYAVFREALKPLREADRLGAVLAQFPYSFAQCEENRMYIKQLAERIGPPLVVEFRKVQWSDDPILNWLEKLGVGYACVDEPKIEGLMPRQTVATSPPAYVRFHGRNAKKWYQHDEPHERYDYRYNRSELEEWSGRIRLLEQKAGHVLVFFNNHFQGKAVESAKVMEKLFELQGRT
jgi:uncharacterized protein YecE (DUF72 family)